jgi:hypothetical protein
VDGRSCIHTPPGEVRAAQGSLASRREIRNRQFLFAQIKNSSKTESPFRSDGFRTAREADGSPEFGSRPRTLGLFPRIKFTPIKRVPPGKLGNQHTPENNPDRPRVKIPRTDTLLWNAKLLGCNAENYVPPATYLLGALTRSETRHWLTLIQRSLSLFLNPTKAKPAQLDDTASHFIRIGVPSAQRSGRTVSRSGLVKGHDEPNRG